MIDPKKVSLALKLLAKTTADSVPVTLTSSYSYQPDANESYVVDFVSFNQESGGLADDSFNIMYSFYQLSIRTPKDQPDNDCFDLANVFLAAFYRGRELTNDGQMVRIRHTDKTGIRHAETHKEMILTVNYSVIA